MNVSNNKKNVFDFVRVKRLVKEGSWIIVGQIVSVSGSLFLVKVLTGYLKPEQYGELALGLTAVALVNQVVMGGISSGVARFYSIALDKQSVGGYLKASEKLLTRATSAIIIMSLVILVSLQFLGRSQWIPLMIAATLLSVLSGYNSVFNSIQNADRQRVVVALNSGLDAWLKILLAVIVMYWYGKSSTSVMIGFAFSCFIVTALQFYLLWKKFQHSECSYVNQEYYFKHIWSFAWPFTVWGIPAWGLQASSRWSLEFFCTTSEVGLFQALSQIGFTPVQLFTVMVIQFISPILFVRSGDATDSDKNKNVKKVVNRLALIGLLATVFFSLIALYCHEFIFTVFVANKYKEVSFLLPWTILAGGFLAVSQILCSQLFSELRSKEIIPVGVISGIFGIIITFLLVRLYGINGAVAALCAYALLNVIWVYFLATKQKGS
jgi:O-antigen/teichoic acid export membrane protein